MNVLCFTKNQILFLKCLIVARIIQRKLLPVCMEIFTSRGTEASWMKRDMSGLLEELMISLTLLGEASAFRFASWNAAWRDQQAGPSCRGWSLLVLSQVPHRPLWGGECIDTAPGSLRRGCCQQPRPSPRGGKGKQRKNVERNVLYSKHQHPYMY